MAANRLRVYYGPEDDLPFDDPPLREAPRETVTVQLKKVLPLFADAMRNDRTWLEDFVDDNVTLSKDLYEVMCAYQQYRRPGT